MKLVELIDFPESCAPLSTHQLPRRLLRPDPATGRARRDGESVRVVELIDLPEGVSTEHGPARGHRLIICCGNGHVVCFDLTQQRLVRDVTVTP